MDSGIELNEQDASSNVVHRTPTHSKAGDDEAEILDQDQQQQVIDNLTKDYDHMVKSQRYSFIILTLIISIACIFASYSTGNHKILLPAAAAYFSLLLVEFMFHSSRKLAKSTINQKENENEKNDAKNESSVNPTNTRTNNLWIWAITAIFEIYSIYCSYKFGSQSDSIKKMPIIILHVGYFILVAFLISSQKFSQTFPEEIKNLQKLKYGSKLA